MAKAKDALPWFFLPVPVFTPSYVQAEAQNPRAFVVQQRAPCVSGAVTREAGVEFGNDIVAGPGGRQILIEDPSGNPAELFERGPDSEK